MKHELSVQANKIIESYLAIKVGKWKIRCPYFMNVRGVRGLVAVYAGKGLPQEIEIEADKLYQKHSYIKNEISAKSLLILAGLGIDCSGLVANVLGIQKVIQPTFFRSLMSIFRPQTNISVQLLTDPANSKLVKWEDVMPGDIIKQGRRHVMLIEWVDRVNGKPTEVCYIESNISPKWGVQRHTIKKGAWKRFTQAEERGLYRLSR